MDYSKQFENNEQRCRFGSTSTLQRVMPGGDYLEDGINIIGAIPAGAVIESFRVIAVGWDTDITVSIGVGAIPNLFFYGTVLVNNISQGNDQLLPVELYFPEGSDIICEITVGNGGEQGLLEFVIDYSEVDTTCGAYTA